MIQLFIGVVTEGVTDIRFLNSILEKTFLNVAHECHNQVEIGNIEFFASEGNGFVEKMVNASQKGSHDYGISILCIHADQDGQDVYANKITPYLQELSTKDSEVFCKVIVPIIPVRMIEAWMMADKELLKEKIYGQAFRDIDLKLHRDPESYAHPKTTIEEAIRITQNARPKKRRDEVSISDLYSDIGSSIELDKLRLLPSFQDFETNVRNAFVELHYIVPN